LKRIHLNSPKNPFQCPKENTRGNTFRARCMTNMHVSVSEEFKTKYYNSMNYEPKTPEERRFRDFFKKEILPMIRQEKWRKMRRF
jgi:hypothetical protein